ncbi:MAG: hypothetical protein QXR84_05915 [Candidatus Bathyarchaeia archaeon]|nr:hypothetical protein [Candidatus Bathyarchaeota archaeon]
MWALVIGVGWFLSGRNFWLPAIPILFMSFGDGVTEMVRNLCLKGEGSIGLGT